MYLSQEEFSPFKRWMSSSAMIKSKNSDDKLAQKKCIIYSKIGCRFSPCLGLHKLLFERQKLMVTFSTLIKN